MEDCVFCLLKNETEKHLLSDENYFIVKDIRPSYEIHLLVITREHFDNFMQADEKTLTSVLLFIRKACQYFEIDKFKVLNNNIMDQEINHIHFHIKSGAQL